MTGRGMRVLAVVCAAALIGGCAESMSLVRLPEFARLPEKALNKDQQQGKVSDMIEKAQTHEAEAARRIESRK